MRKRFQRWQPSHDSFKKKQIKTVQGSLQRAPHLPKLLSLNLLFRFAAVVWDKLFDGKQFGYCLPPQGSAAAEIDEKQWFVGRGSDMGFLCTVQMIRPLLGETAGHRRDRTVSRGKSGRKLVALRNDWLWAAAEACFRVRISQHSLGPCFSIIQEYQANLATGQVDPCYLDVLPNI